MGSTGFEVVVNSYIIQPEITVNIGESYLNVTKFKWKRSSISQYASSS